MQEDAIFADGGGGGSSSDDEGDGMTLGQERTVRVRTGVSDEKGAALYTLGELCRHCPIAMGPLLPRAAEHMRSHLGVSLLYVYSTSAPLPMLRHCLSTVCRRGHVSPLQETFLQCWLTACC